MTTELEVQRVLVEAAQVLGYRHCHFRPARTAQGWRTPISGDVGFPDLVLARARPAFSTTRPMGDICLAADVFAFELKGDRGRKRTPAQELWAEALGGGKLAGLEYRLVTPKTLDEALALLV